MTRNKTHRSMIGNRTVASDYDYIVFGSVRGLVGQHKSIQAARRKAELDAEDCQKAGGYSDAQVYCWDDEDGWCLDATA
jgi:F0F1-type ATP synthase gamma subunit